MRKRRRQFCPFCRNSVIEQQEENGTGRDYCKKCDTIFYDNPLPVVSVILAEGRRIMLVKRKNKPYRGKWCLPSGFAETGESIADAALRELEEETGVLGRVVSLVDVDSATNYFYGDLLFLTFEVERTGGRIKAADDAEAVKFFPVERIPRLAFSSNSKAVSAYMDLKRESWAIADSFAAATDEREHPGARHRNKLSDSLVILIEKHAEDIAAIWLADVISNRSTPGYHTFDRQSLTQRMLLVAGHFGRWLEGSYGGEDIRSFYTNLGRERYLEGFPLSEVITALSLTKKYIREYARSRKMWEKTIDIYMALELEWRTMFFFDEAAFYVIRGYEKMAAD